MAFLPYPLPDAPPNEAPGEEEEHEDAKEHPACSLDQHLQAIHLCRQKIAEQADPFAVKLTMSLDNVLAISALAAGNLPLLAAGLLLSIAFLLLGSALIAELIGRLPWLLDVAALVLAWTAAHMILDDTRLGLVLEHFPWTQFALPAVAFAIVIAADILLRMRLREG